MQLESFEINITAHPKTSNFTIFLLNKELCSGPLPDICHIVNIEKIFIRVITMSKYLLERV